MSLRSYINISYSNSKFCCTMRSVRQHVYRYNAKHSNATEMFSITQNLYSAVTGQQQDQLIHLSLNCRYF